MSIKLAGGIILDSKDRILLIHRQTEKYDHWEVPGGKIEPNESADIAARRELYEELGGVFEIGQKLATAEFHDSGSDLNYSWFLAKTASEPKIMEPQTFAGWRYFSQAELVSGDYNLSEGAKCFVRLLQTGEVKL